MRLTATDIYQLYQPSVCELRVYLKHRAEPEAEPSEYDKVLQELGARHERIHLRSVGPCEDISAGTLEERAEKTKAAAALTKAVLYQPVFITRSVLGGHDSEIIGNPDFLLPDGEGHLIRDTKKINLVRSLWIGCTGPERAGEIGGRAWPDRGPDPPEGVAFVDVPWKDGWVSLTCRLQLGSYCLWHHSC